MTNRTLIIALLPALILFSAPGADALDIDEIMIRDHDGDAGFVPSVPEPPDTCGWHMFWNSPDIKLNPSELYPGIPNQVTVTVHNIENYMVENVEVALFWSLPSLCPCFPSLWTNQINTLIISSIPPDQSKRVVFEWTPPPIDNLRFLMLGARIQTAGDIPEYGWPQWDNNVAMKAVTKAYLPPGDSERNVFRFILGNPDPLVNADAAVFVDRSQIPQDWVVNLSIPEGEFILLAPGDSIWVTATVIPAEDTSGFTRKIDFSSIVDLWCAPPHFTRGGGGMTPALKVTPVTLDLELQEDGNVIPDILEVEATAANHIAFPRQIEYYIQARDPNNNLFPASPMFMAGGTLGGMSSISKVFSHNIPDSFATGPYYYIGLLYDNAGVLLDSTAVQFEVFPDP